MSFRLLGVAGVIAAAAACATAPSAPPVAPFSVVEASIADMQQAMAEGRVTSRQLVEQYLQRIALYEERLNGTLAVNPKALEEADKLDAEFAKTGKLVGPMHGIPILVKDEIDTAGMPTTQGTTILDMRSTQSQDAAG